MVITVFTVFSILTTIFTIYSILTIISKITHCLVKIVLLFFCFWNLSSIVFKIIFSWFIITNSCLTDSF